MKKIHEGEGKVSKAILFRQIIFMLRQNMRRGMLCVKIW